MGRYQIMLPAQLKHQVDYIIGRFPQSFLAGLISLAGGVPGGHIPDFGTVCPAPKAVARRRHGAGYLPAN
ncbi:hypothetical protein ECDEC5E_2627 [Escherichia coli DEC5E]|nr:hypothetical protein ECDEC5E_2627 [Escherichia coli DEC5E]